MFTCWRQIGSNELEAEANGGNTTNQNQYFISQLDAIINSFSISSILPRLSTEIIVTEAIKRTYSGSVTFILR